MGISQVLMLSEELSVKRRFGRQRKIDRLSLKHKSKEGLM